MARCSQCGVETAEGKERCAVCQEHPPVRGRWHPGRNVVLAFLGIVAAIALVFVLAMVYFIRHTTIVYSGKSGGRVESAGATIITSANPAQLARQLGLEIYPQAIGEKGAQAQMDSSTILTLSFRSHDTPRRIIAYYHVRYPDATVRAEGKAEVLVLVSLRDTLTIKAIPSGRTTEINVTDIQH